MLTSTEVKCWLTPEEPSYELIDSLKEKMELGSTVKLLRHDDVKKPVIYIGAGTCGFGAGAGKTIIAIKDFLKSKSIDADLIEVGCIGLCSSEPLVDIQLPGKTRISFSNVTEEKVEQVLSSVFAGELDNQEILGQFRAPGLEPWADVPYLDEHPFFGPQTRWVLGNCGLIDPTSLPEYLSRGGYAAFYQGITSYTPGEICQTVLDSGLRGRGGGGFLTGLKWKAAVETEADQKYLICNADEGDPGAFMDRAVIEGDPYRLLEGLAIAAYAIGATKVYVYIRAEYPLAIERLEHAISEAKKVGLIGEDILGSGFNFNILIKKGAGAFVCGEETALINSIEGKGGCPNLARHIRR